MSQAHADGPSRDALGVRGARTAEAEVAYAIAEEVAVLARHALVVPVAHTADIQCAFGVNTALVGVAIDVQEATRAVWEVALAVERVVDGLANILVAGPVGREVRATLAKECSAIGPVTWARLGEARSEARYRC